MPRTTSTQPFVTIPHPLIHRQPSVTLRPRLIGLTSSWHCTASTLNGWVHFHHVRPVYLNGAFTFSFAPHLGLLYLSTHDNSAFFHKFATLLLSIHNSFTPTNIPTTSILPFCHNCPWISPLLAQTDHDFSRYHNVSRWTKNCIPVTEWLYLPAVNIAHIAHAASESIFTMWLDRVMLTKLNK